MVFAAMRARLRRCHSITCAAEKGMLEEQRRDTEFDRVKLREDVVCIISAVVIAHPGMVTSYNKVRTTVILAYQRVKNRLTWTRVTHTRRKYTKHYPLVRIIARK